ncbi:MAG: lipocalin family protein [Candidatus Cloacimonetes bacterium]|nr:lipocalin family protein [Candidatus Cloacimonadota bacterium]MCF7812993.1 lipocalin family protein [Candidatus Cloacimonadota bacterium]MCF7867275.1 lipocalin family protein [Candidatus Cloacimonadota bacterium]MCF7882719.1 lipocalin family protein [Candidatus Cloacimonadota bacterium]
MKSIGLFVIILAASNCFAAPKTTGIKVVEDFKLERYLGKWYEIARLPHFFEKNLQQVTATYTLLENGKIEVLNRGYNTKKQKWSESKGKAWIPDETKPSELKVSFFWPFSSAYRIIYLEEDYSLAIVTSKSFNYFWILSRTPQIAEEYYNRLIEKAGLWGFNKEEIIKVKHD